MANAPLFPRWSNGVFAMSAAVAIGGVLALPVLLMAWVRTPVATGRGVPMEQPVVFDHRHHVVDDHIDCMYCHDLADKSPYAGVPPTERCLNCHNQIWNGSPMLSLVWRSYTEDRPIPWRQVHRLADFVYFDHSIHVAKGVGCETCHGRVDRMARVYQVAPLTMHWCLDCHRDPAPHLRPRDQVTAMGWTPPDDSLGRELARTNDVHPSTNCTTCHR
jgi:hypothetical protein